MELVRFGYSIWNCAQMQVIFFHASLSTASGRETDQHGERAAMEGIFDPREMEWVRGPAGVKRASWYEINALLEKTGVVRVRRSGAGRGAVKEYELDWLVIKARIDSWKEEGSSNWTLSGKEGSSKQTLSGEEGSSKQTLSRDSPRADAEHAGGLVSLTDFDFDFKSLSVIRAEVAAAVEAACGQRPKTDRLLDEIIEAGRKTHLPYGALQRFIHDRAYEWHQKGKLVTAGLFGNAAREDLIPWINKNREFLAGLRRAQALEAQKRAQPREMPASSEGTSYDVPPQAEQKPDPQFTRDLMNEVTQRRKSKGA
jgi:hypothetical protein